MELLIQRGATNINYNDPYVPEVTVDGNLFKCRVLTKELLQQQDVVVVTTAHSVYDAEFIVEHSKAVVDTRNITKNVKNSRHKIVKLGSGVRF